MRFLLLFIFSLFACWVLAQDTLNQVDQNGLKQGHWIYYGKDRPESGIPSDGKVEEGDYINNRKEGYWIKYHIDGKTAKIKGFYFNNRPKGSYEKYYLNGSIKEKGCFDVKGIYCENDTSYFYDLQGKLTSKSPYDANGIYEIRRGGSHNFPVEYIYQEDKSDEFIKNKQNKFDDSLTYYLIKGSDQPQSKFPPDGKVEEGYTKNDRREGKIIKYHTDGVTPKLIGFYVNNRPSGIYQKFFESGKLKETGFFYKNVYTDSLKRFYENGQLEYEGFYDSIGKEQGRVNYYYENGKLEYTYFAVNGRPKNTIHLSEKGDTIYEIKGFAEPCIYSSTIKRSEPNLGKKAPTVTLPPNTKAVKWQLNGYNKVYNGDNEIWQDGIFKEGQLWDGKVYVYDRDGILLQVEIYKSGFYHSDGQL